MLPAGRAEICGAGEGKMNPRYQRGKLLIPPEAVFKIRAEQNPMRLLFPSSKKAALAAEHQIPRSRLMIIG